MHNRCYDWNRVWIGNQTLHSIRDNFKHVENGVLNCSLASNLWSSLVMANGRFWNLFIFWIMPHVLQEDEHDMGIDTVSSVSQSTAKHPLPELEIFCYLLFLIFLIDEKKYSEVSLLSFFPLLWNTLPSSIFLILKAFSFVFFRLKLVRQPALTV